MLPFAVAVSASVALVVASASTNCTQGPNTACSSEWTCCQTEYSDSNTGCCLLPNAVCCGNAPPPSTLRGKAVLDGLHDPLPSWGVGYCCPQGHKCMNITGGGIGCLPSNWGEAAAISSSSSSSSVDRVSAHRGPDNASPIPANYVCKPGASKPASSTHPNVMILGDSVSIGYTPPTATALASKAFVQHSPWDTRGGGSGTTSYGLACLPNLVRTSMGEPVHWDVIAFNYGLHDLDPAIASQEQYEAELKEIATKLDQYTTRRLYALTTPYMPDKTQGIPIVQDLNTRAIAVMKDLGIPVVDLYSAVTDVCGDVYTNCTICRKTPCSYHYTPEGYEDIAKVLAPAIEALLPAMK